MTDGQRWKTFNGWLVPTIARRARKLHAMVSRIPSQNAPLSRNVNFVCVSAALTIRDARKGMTSTRAMSASSRPAKTVLTGIIAALAINIAAEEVGIVTKEEYSVYIVLTQCVKTAA